MLAILSLTGCVYRLPPVVPPSKQQLLLTASDPGQYTVQVRDSDYHVPTDGRVVFGVPAMRSGCSVSFFGIPVHRAADITREKMIAVVVSGTVVRRLSLRDLLELPVDGDGYHRLSIAEGKLAKRH